MSAPALTQADLGRATLARQMLAERGSCGVVEAVQRLAGMQAAGASSSTLPDAPRPGGDADAPLRPLPEFDTLDLAWEDRSRVIAPEHRPLVTTKNLRVRATFLVDGVVAGSWTIVVKRRVATLTLEPSRRAGCPGPCGASSRPKRTPWCASSSPTPRTTPWRWASRRGRTTA